MGLWVLSAASIILLFQICQTDRNLHSYVGLFQVPDAPALPAAAVESVTGSNFSVKASVKGPTYSTKPPFSRSQLLSGM